MDNLTRIRIMNILHEMEATIRNDRSISKDLALDLMLSVDRFWDELKGDSHLEEKWGRATASWERVAPLREYTQRLHEQLF